MKNTLASQSRRTPQILDIHEPEHAARLGEAFFRERQNVQAALAELAGMRYVDRRAREETALTSMATLPGHALMERAPREILRLRAALFLVSCHAHRHN